MSAAMHRRAVARKLAVQALYRWQINPGPWQDLVREFDDATDMPKADREFFVEIVRGTAGEQVAIDESLARFCDRPTASLDPIEHAVLWLGLFEMQSRPDVPWRVVIDEAVGLARRFGATDGHKYVNAVLDRAARELRPNEH